MWHVVVKPRELVLEHGESGQPAADDDIARAAQKVVADRGQDLLVRAMAWQPQRAAGWGAVRTSELQIRVAARRRVILINQLRQMPVADIYPKTMAWAFYGWK